MCLAFAVEEGDVFVGADAQDVEVADDVVGQGDGLSDGKVFGQVESGHSFGGSDGYNPSQRRDGNGHYTFARRKFKI